MTAALKRRRFTVDEYHRMVEAGILTAHDRVELLEGEIVEVPAAGGRHAGQVKRLSSLFAVRLGPRVVVRVHSPLRLSADSEARPDFALLRPRPDSYQGLPPSPDDVLVIAHVLDAAAEIDRRVKTPLYARAGIRETWLLDVSAHRLEAYRNPGADGYRDLRILRRGESLTIEALPDLTLSVGDLLG